MSDAAALTIRLATLSDVDALRDIYAPYVLTTGITFEYEPPTHDEFCARMKSVLAFYPYLVAEHPQTGIVGYAYASTFKGRPAYDWAVETSIYVARDARRLGAGRALHQELERCLAAQGILNMEACIAYPKVEDEFLTLDSVRFHERMGYRMVGKFESCGYKDGRWLDMVWMEKLIGEHTNHQHPPIAFSPQLLATSSSMSL